MPPPGRKSSGKQKARVEDSDSEGDDGRLPKYENIQPEYLNQSIDSKVGETKLKSLITDLAAGVKELKESAKMMIEVAADLASSLSQPGQSENLDYDNLPEDPVSYSSRAASSRRVHSLTRVRFACRRRSRRWTLRCARCWTSYSSWT